MSTTDLTSSLLSDAAGVLAFVVRASVLGSCGILLTCLVRRVCGKRLSPALRLALWTPAMLLLLMPRLPDLGFGLAAAVPAIVPEMPVGAPDEDGPSQDSEVQLPALGVAEPVPALQTGWSLTLGEGMALVWCTVIFLMLAWWMIAHLLWWRRVARQSGPVSSFIAELFAECCGDVGLRNVPRLLVSRAVENPAVSGLLRPSVIIPEDLETTLSPAELRHVLLHEAAHVRRQDLRWHMATLVVLALHWFNPLVWLAVRLMRADREAACDAMVLSVIPGDAREAYGATLLRIQERLAHLIAPHSRLGSLGSADMLRERILDIVHHGRRSSRWGTAALVLSTVCAGLVAILGAEPSKDGQPAPLFDNEHMPLSKDPAFRASLLCGASDTSKLEAFIESQIAALKHPELRQKTEERVKLQHPELAATTVAFDVFRKSGSAVITLTAAASDANYVGRWLDALLDEIAADRKKVEEAEREAVRASPEFKELSKQEKKVVQLVAEQRAAESVAAPAAKLIKLKEKLEVERKVYRDLKARLDIAAPTFYVVIFQRPFALDRPDAVEKKAQQSPPSPQPTPPLGSPVSRARIALEPLPEEMERRYVEELFATQIDKLQSDTLRKKAEERVKARNPEITPVTVTVSAARVSDTSQVSILAWGTDELYVRTYLSALLDELVAFRQEQFRHSIQGTLQAVIEEVLVREKRVNYLSESYKQASSQNAPQERIAKLKSELERENEWYQTWLAKLEKLRFSNVEVSPFIKVKILERPS
jgi:beta-lactamase regulating signal transducer with metallopeptidase domain